GTDQDLIFKMRDEQRPERPTMTRIYTAGQGFVYKGGYGGLAGVNEGIADVAEVRPAVDAQASKHVDIIKLWMDDHLGTAKKMPYDIAMHVQRSWHLLSALFTAKFNSRTVPAGDMLRAIMPTPAQFAACKQLSLRPKAVYAEGCACRAI